MLLNASFERLPAEILEAIISQPSLRSEDIRSIRLVSKAFTDICARYLFRQVHISALHKDREAFLHVAQSPRLAYHVQTLVWEELTGNFDLLNEDELGNSTTWSSFSRPRDEYDMLADIASQIKPLFWLMPKHIEGQDKGARKSGDSLPFWSEFIDAVDKFPALQSFESRPMHPDRQLQSATDGYPLTARVVSGFFNFNDWNFAFTSANNTVFNIGFLFYIVPLLNRRTERRDQRQTKLCFTDEAIPGSTALGHLTADDAPAFRHIDHLELRLCEYLKHQTQDITGLSACLAAAVNLTHFHFRYIQDRDYNTHKSPLLEIPILPALHTLCLEDVVLEGTCHHSIEFNPQATLDHEQPAFVDFVQRHAGTLQKLYILSSSVTEHAVRELVKIPALKLERFVIVPPDREVDTCALDEADLLKFINWKGDSDLDGNKSSGGPAPCLKPFWAAPSTHDRLRAWQDWVAEANVNLHPNTAWVDMDSEDDDAEAMDIDVDGRAWEICRTYDSESGLWIDNDGVCCDPRTDREHVKPESEPTPLQTNHREWDNELGLWRDVATNSLHKFANDRPTNDKPHDPENHSHENDLNPSTNPYIADEFPTQHDEIHIAEDFEHHAGLLTSKQWFFGRDDSNTLYYWQVLLGKGHPTELWHFTHRNGEEAYGADPLDFWADWQGTKAGDTVSASPYGWRLWLFHNNIQISEHLKGDEIPTPEEIGTLYGEPVIYDVDGDPMSWWKFRADVAPPRGFGMDDYEVCFGDMNRAAMAERDDLAMR